MKTHELDSANLVNSFAQCFWNWMLPMAWQLAILVAILFVLTWLLRNRCSARLRYAMWMIVPVRLVLPPTLALATSWGWWFLPPQAAESIQNLADASSAAPLDVNQESISKPGVTSTFQPFLNRELLASDHSSESSESNREREAEESRQAAQEPPGLTFRSPHSQSSSTDSESIEALSFRSRVGDEFEHTTDRSTLAPSASTTAIPATLQVNGRLAGFLFWGVGCLAMIVRLIYGWLQIARIYRRASTPHQELTSITENCRSLVGLQRSVALLVSGEISAPMVVGVLRATILLPERIENHLNIHELRTVIVHEMQHVRRCDPLTNFAIQTISILYWFHPAVWIAMWQVRRLRELACDEQTVQSLAGERKAYAMGLVKVAEMISGRHPVSSLGFIERKREMKLRVMKILDSRLKTGRGLSLPSLAIVVLLALFLIPGARRPAPRSGHLDSTPVNLPSQGKTQDDVPGQWLTGDAENLTIHFRGKYVNEKGEPIEDVEMSAVSNSTNSRKVSLRVKRSGNEFHFALPTNVNSHSITLIANSSDNRLQASRLIDCTEYRRVASAGLEVKLLPATRKLKVIAEHQGRPVADANVYVQFNYGYKAYGRTDAAGLAEIPCLAQPRLRNITVYKPEEFIGGYRLDRDSIHYSDDDLQRVDLVAMRDQRVKIVDADGNSVPHASFTLNIARNIEDRNYLSTDEVFSAKTDAKGVAMVDWFPDFEQPVTYAFMLGDQWLANNDNVQWVDDCLVFEVVRSKRDKRVTVVGRLSSLETMSLAGYNVRLKTFQAEVDGTYESLTTFTAEDGTFAAQVLPGATYVCLVDDPEWVTLPKAEVLYDPESKITAIPQLEITKGQEVQIIATLGPERVPYPDLQIHLSSEFDFDWMEDGEKRSGSMGRSGYVTTNSQGIVKVPCSIGPLEYSVYNTDWRISDKTEVVEGKPTIIKIHRPASAPIKVTGRIKPSTMRDDCELIVAAFDGATKGQETVLVNSQGQFTFDTISSKVGIYAYKKDNSIAAFRVVDIPTTNLEIEFEKQAPYRGRLLDANNHPVENARMIAYVDFKEVYRRDFAYQRKLEGKRMETRTDSEGFFAFASIPSGISFDLSIDPETVSGKCPSIPTRYRFPNVEMPLDIIRLVGDSNPPTPDILTRFATTLKDCELYDLRLLAVITSDDDSVAFANRILSSYDDRAILGYLPRLIEPESVTDDSATSELMHEYHFEVPPMGSITFVALDPDGSEVDRLTMDVQQENVVETAQQFLTTHEPPAGDARKLFAHAIAEAKRTNRLVWAQHSQTRCAPCYLFSRWIDEHREVLEKDFVFVKIDDVRQEGGIEVTRKITGGRNFGIPFVAIMNTNEQVLADAEGPFGNFGFPNDFVSAVHLRQMLKQGQQRITDDELDQLIQSLIELERN